MIIKKTKKLKNDHRTKFLKEKLNMSRYVKPFDKKKFAELIGLLIGLSAVSQISEYNINIWLSFVLYSTVPVVVYILSYFVLSKIVNFQFKIDDLMIVLPWEQRTSINSLALTFSLWLTVSVICTYMWGFALHHHFGILLGIGLPILLVPSIALFSFLFFVMIAKFFIKLRNKFK